MPETRPERLSYARGALEKLRKAHENLSREELLDLVCHLTKTYVLEQTIPFDVPMPERADPADLPDVPDPSAAVQDDPEATPARRFARLIEGLKRRTNLPQLEGFSVQDGRAVLIVDNQKVTFGERVTIEFVPVRQNPVAAAPVQAEPPPAPSPRQPGAPAAPGAPGAPTRPAPAGAAPFEPQRPAAMRPVSASRPARAPGAPTAGAPARPAPPPEPAPAQPASDDVDQNAIERFRRLELD